MPIVEDIAPQDEEERRCEVCLSLEGRSTAYGWLCPACVENVRAEIMSTVRVDLTTHLMDIAATAGRLA